MSKKSVKYPVRPIRHIVKDSNDPGYVNRILIGTPSTGAVRIEWHAARMFCVMPVNWSSVSFDKVMPGFYPLRYLVADAQNVIVREFIEKDFEWLFLLEHDVVVPSYTFVLLDQYMRADPHPLVSGLYYSRGTPSLPLVFRGRGNGAYTRFGIGDKVWCDGVPTGCLLIHRSILKVLWDESPEYIIRVTGEKTRRVFITPRVMWTDPETGAVNTSSGTSDLDFCSRIMKDDILEKAGWSDYLEKLPDREYPFLLDTRLFCRHMELDGSVYPHYWQQVAAVAEKMTAATITEVVGLEDPEIGDS